MTIEVTYNVTDIYISSEVSPIYIDVNYQTSGGGAAVWGGITGTLSNQTDLQTALDAKVPYSGATGNVNLGEYEMKAGQVTLDTSPTGTAAVGTTRWNDTIGSSETTLKGGSVVLKNGVDLVARVVNKVSPNTTLTKAAYQAVRVSGAQGQRLAVAFAQANNDNNSADTIGLVIETIATNQEGFIITVGQIDGINTTGSLQGETWADGDVLYLSPSVAGALTNIKPTGATGHIVIVGYVEYAHANNGKIYVKVMNGWELDELHNVSISSVANNQGLFYNSTSSLWENKSISTVLGYTPEQPLTFSSPLSRLVNAVSIPAATSSVNGYLSSIDWSTFNGKENALTFSSPLSRSTNTISIPQATSSVSGFLSSTDWSTFNSKQGALTLTTTGTSGAATLVGNTLNIPQYSGGGGMAIGGSITSATAGSVLFAGTSGVLAQDNTNLFWDDANDRLGIRTSSPNAALHVSGSTTASGAIARGANYTPTLVAAANNDVLVGLDVNPTFTNGAFTGVTNYAARFQENILVSKNQNSATTLFVTNATSGTSSQVGLQLSSNNGAFSFFKFSSTTSTYKILSANDNCIYSGTSGDIAILNDTPTAGFKIAVGSSSTAHFRMYANGNIGISQNTDAGFRLDVSGTCRVQSKLSLSAGTTSNAQINLASSTAPTSPNNGDIWFDGTDLKMRIGGVTKTFTLI